MRKAQGLCYVSIAATIMAAASLRWLTDASSPWATADEEGMFSLLCCLPVTPVLVLVSIVCLAICVVRSVSKESGAWHQCLGPALLGTFVYYSLPLMGALSTPKRPAGEGHFLEHDCEWIKENVLWFAREGTGRYRQTEDIWLDIDGDGDLERWEYVDARGGGIGFVYAAFIYEPGEFVPRWCGYVGASQSLDVAWIRPINLDLDVAPEIWMRSTFGLLLPIPETDGFWELSPDQEREFDSRLLILFVLLPIRVLPLVIWFQLRDRPIPSLAVGILTILMYILIS